jgi:hypothetical protein
MGCFAEKPWPNLEFYPSFVFRQWTSIPMPIYLVITH